LEPASANAARILVIDDNPIIQRSIYFVLRDLGHHVILSGDVFGALKAIREQPLDLILLDLNFPFDNATATSAVQDGFGILGWIRHRDETRNTPVIIISSDPPEKSKARALVTGAAAYLPKPVDRQTLIATVSRCLSTATERASITPVRSLAPVPLSGGRPLRMCPVKDPAHT
jgi:CheY-like chemotaxis protein